MWLWMAYLTDWLTISWPIDWLSGRLIDWLIDSLVVGWLIIWLRKWSINPTENELTPFHYLWDWLPVRQMPLQLRNSSMISEHLQQICPTHFTLRGEVVHTREDDGLTRPLAQSTRPSADGSIHRGVLCWSLYVWLRKNNDRNKKFLVTKAM